MRDDGRELLFEIMDLGGWMRVCVVDPVTAEEVVVTAPSGTARADLERLARRRMIAHLAARGLLASANTETDTDAGGAPRRDPRGGIIV